MEVTDPELLGLCWVWVKQVDILLYILLALSISQCTHFEALRWEPEFPSLLLFPFLFSLFS